MSELQKITEEQMDAVGVVSAPDVLSGTPAENKNIFDKMVRQLVAPAYNAAVDAINAIEQAESGIQAEEEKRVEAEKRRAEGETSRVESESLRKTAEDLRVQSENTRVTAEGKRVQAEAGRVTAEGLRVQAENLRVTAEQGRVQAENSRVSAEQARVQAEQERVNTTTGIVAQATAQAQEAERSAAAAADSEQAAKEYSEKAEDSKSKAASFASSAQMSGSLAQKEAMKAQDAASSASSSASTASQKASDAASSASAAKTSETNADGSEAAARQHMEDAQAAQRAIENMTVSSKTLPPGSAATVKKTTVGDVVNLEYGIPRGDQGQGFKILGYYPTVEALQSAVPAPSVGDAYGIGSAQPYDIYIWDGSKWVNNGPIQGPAGPQGEDGADGKAATIKVGTVTTGAPGSQATVNNSGTQSDAVFDFTIPRGADGTPGAKGDPGVNGKSAYQTAVDAGYTGTEADFNAALLAMKDSPFLSTSGGTVGEDFAILDTEKQATFFFSSGGIVFGSVNKDDATKKVTMMLSGNMGQSGAIVNISVENGADNRSAIGISSAGVSFIGPVIVDTPTSGKNPTTKDYVDGLVGTINTALDAINGEVV